MNGLNSTASTPTYEESALAQGTDYGRYDDKEVDSSHEYLYPAILKALQASLTDRAARRVLDLGCGNGGLTARLSAGGLDVTGVDASDQGIAIAKARHPTLQFFQGSCYDDLTAQLGQFPLVVCTEVIEHLYWPRKLLKCAYDLLEPNGRLILTTPYHGYLKNLALSLTGRMEAHFDSCTDDGHIKFFSERTLRTLILGAGFRQPRFGYIGRISILAKSMLVNATK